MTNHPLPKWLERLGRAKRPILAVSIATVVLVVGGCTLPSQVSEFPPVSAAADQVHIDASNLLAKAIQVTDTDETAQSFWYTGYVKNNIGRRTTTSMYDGIVLRPKQAYLVNGRVATRAYQYFNWGGESYIRRGETWFEGNPELQLPFDPLRGFEDWLPLLKDAVQLPDEEILSTPTNVVQVKLSAQEWIEQSPSTLFDDIRAAVADDEALTHLLDNTVVKMTLWIGKEDAPQQANYILQYSTWMVMPLPQGGYFDQETFFRFLQHGDPAIEDQLGTPDRVKKYVVRGELVEVDEEE